MLTLVGSGLVLGLIGATLSWPVVYAAIRTACTLDGVPAPRHLPGWPQTALAGTACGAAVNVITGVHVAAIGAGPVTACLVAGAYLVPALHRHRSAAKARRRRLLEELARENDDPQPDRPEEQALIEPRSSIR